jgi:hypothetical protein
MLYGGCGRWMLMGGSLRGLRERTTGPIGTCLSEDDELRQLLEGVTEAGSWAVWMGVFSKSWMKLLVAGGPTFKLQTSAHCYR